MTRILPPGTREIGAPDALVVPPGSATPGRIATRGPLRREGPAKLTGVALYADDLEGLRSFYERMFGLRVIVSSSNTSRASSVSAS